MATGILPLIPTSHLQVLSLMPSAFPWDKPLLLLSVPVAHRTPLLSWGWGMCFEQPVISLSACLLWPPWMVKSLSVPEVDLRVQLSASRARPPLWLCWWASNRMARVWECYNPLTLRSRCSLNLPTEPKTESSPESERMTVSGPQPSCSRVGCIFNSSGAWSSKSPSC